MFKLLVLILLACSCRIEQKVSGKTKHEVDTKSSIVLDINIAAIEEVCYPLEEVIESYAQCVTDIADIYRSIASAVETTGGLDE